MEFEANLSVDFVEAEREVSTNSHSLRSPSGPRSRGAYARSAADARPIGGPSGTTACELSFSVLAAPREPVRVSHGINKKVPHPPRDANADVRGVRAEDSL
ncbi:hypothetical protein EVAR_74619_1 [Eumeta japonica]|uniref:Uncharacterized protein n=1 Tax=Eumeta variegata TaxID=151549 RepID=A0A4C1WD67_EUMVA|nr:hypothetical protein EVAR_74619_1 [Eumeta japonica]